MTVKRRLLVAAFAISALAMMTESSNAFFGRRGGGSCGSSGGSGGSWGSHGGSWGGGWRGGHGSWGSHGGGWGGSHGSGGGWGSHGSHGSYGAVYYGGGGYASRGIIRDRYVVRESAQPVIVAATPAVPAVKTRLTLNVPAEAKVTLAGVETKQSGEVRQFSTTKLSAGQVWDGYQVVVEMQKDGQTIREERTLQLTGGKPQELTVNFDSNQLAQRQFAD